MWKRKSRPKREPAPWVRRIPKVSEIPPWVELGSGQVMVDNPRETPVQSKIPAPPPR